MTHIEDVVRLKKLVEKDNGSIAANRTSKLAQNSIEYGMGRMPDSNQKKSK